MNYRGEQSNFAKEIRAFAALIQQLEDTFFEIASMRTLSQAVGKQLDVLGELIGGGYTPRLGRTDSEYRSLLYSQCKLNHTHGEPERLILAIKALSGAAVCTYREFLPLAISINFLSSTLPDYLFAQMNRIKAGGVRLDLIQSDPTEAFTLAEGSTAETDSVHGLSDLSMTTGGLLSNLLT